MSQRAPARCRTSMPRVLPLALIALAACGAPAGSDAGVDGGFDAGAAVTCIPSRLSCEWPGRWHVAAALAEGFDAGGFSPCLPLPPLDWTFSLSPDDGALCTEATVAWADDAGCALDFRAAFTSTNPSEQYRHAVVLALDAADGGVSGGGTYELTGGSHCTVPLTASGARVP